MGSKCAAILFWKHTVFTIQSMNLHFTGSLFNASTALLTLYNLISLLGTETNSLVQGQFLTKFTLVSFLGPRGPLGTPSFVRPSVRPRQKSKSPLKPYKSSKDHARPLIWNIAARRTMSSIIWWWQIQIQRQRQIQRQWQNSRQSLCTACTHPDSWKIQRQRQKLRKSHYSSYTQLESWQLNTGCFFPHWYPP